MYKINFLKLFLFTFITIIASSCDDHNHDEEGHTDAEGFIFEENTVYGLDLDLKIYKSFSLLGKFNNSFYTDLNRINDAINNKKDLFPPPINK